MLGALKNLATAALANLRGWKTDRKIVVFQSDDWGCTRIHDIVTAKALRAKGIRILESSYDRVDTLESRCDLEKLFEVLSRHEDGGGNKPAFTLNFIVGNPDYPKIRESGFQSYTVESLDRTYERVRGENLIPLILEAHENGLVAPQFHGREHLNYELWLSDLRSGNPDVIHAFDHEYFGLPTVTGSRYQSHYLAAYWAESQGQLEAMADSIISGLNLFEHLFGKRSISMVPCNYVLPEELEMVAADAGVSMMQLQRGYTVPLPESGKFRIRRISTGERNAASQLCVARNVIFEPFDHGAAQAVSDAVRQIRSAFFFRTPAVVSTHRANYAGGLSQANRDTSLELLDRLLYEVLAHWPDVEFMTTESLYRQMTASHRC